MQYMAVYLHDNGDPWKNAIVLDLDYPSRHGFSLVVFEDGDVQLVAMSRLRLIKPVSEWRTKVSGGPRWMDIA